MSERVWISDAQRVTLELLGTLAAVDKELSKRANAGEKITQDHYWAYLAEEVTRNIPPGTHYLRSALAEADRMKAAQAARIANARIRASLEATV